MSLSGFHPNNLRRKIIILKIEKLDILVMCSNDITSMPNTIELI